MSPFGGERVVIYVYAALGLLLTLLFLHLSAVAEASGDSAAHRHLSTVAEASGDTAAHRSRLGAGASRKVVRCLASMVALDSFGGGFERPVRTL